jgi:hypothetical protein
MAALDLDGSGKKIIVQKPHKVYIQEHFGLKGEMRADFKTLFC